MRRCPLETIKLWARHGDTVREAIELGDFVHLNRGSEDSTDAVLLFAIESGLLSRWAGSFLGP